MNIPDGRGLLFSGDRVKIIGLSIDGLNVTSQALYLTGERPTVSGCVISNLFAEERQVLGVAIRNDGRGCYIHTNTFSDLFSTPNPIGGDGPGSCRAVSIHSLTPASLYNIVSNNYIENVEGEEGDSIHFLFSAENIRNPAKGIVSNNHIYNFSRRGIKIQASDVVIRYNTIINDLEIEPEKPNRCIDIQLGINVSVISNTIREKSGYFGGIGVTGLDDFRITGILVKDNDIYIENGVCIFATNASGLVFHGNIVYIEEGRAIAFGGSCDNYVIASNIITCQNAGPSNNIIALF